MSEKEIYPRVNLDGKCFMGLGKMDDDITVTITGKIISTREDEYGACVGVEVYGVGSPGKKTKVVPRIVNEADSKLDALVSPSTY